MHIDYYGFREHPFLMTPDARLFYASSVHAKAYAHLMYGIAQREGFVVITGEVGAGKTTLLERLVGELDAADFAIARIATTQVSGDDLLRLVAGSFGAAPGGDKAAVLSGIVTVLRTSPRRHLLIVDEAQALSPTALEELRMLSNITDGSRALLQTILMGQPQLRHLMASPDLDQLRQRVLASFHLSGLSREETHAYVRHRLTGVGWLGVPGFEEAALDRVHALSGGIPRRINRLCSRVLLAGALEQALQLTAEMVEETAQELEEDLGGGAPAEHAAAVPDAVAPGPQLRAELDVLAAGVDALAARVEALEHLLGRHDRIFGQMMDALTEAGGRRP